MGDVPDPILIETTKLEKELVDKKCVKGGCNENICYWSTPDKNGFTAPNPQKFSHVPIDTLVDLLKKIQLLDARPIRPMKPPPGFDVV